MAIIPKWELKKKKTPNSHQQSNKTKQKIQNSKVT